jgi:hypothetical protein
MTPIGHPLLSKDPTPSIKKRQKKIPAAVMTLMPMIAMSTVAVVPASSDLQVPQEYKGLRVQVEVAPDRLVLQVQKAKPESLELLVLVQVVGPQVCREKLAYRD